MNRQPHSAAREIIVAESIRELVSELRLVDLVDYVAFIRMEHFSTLADIVDSAAELYFLPGTIRLGHGGEAHVSWEESPRIVLDMEMRPSGATVYFSLTLEAQTASVEVNYVAFDRAEGDPEANTAHLRAMLRQSRLTREPAALP
ncbi:MAG: hypothetical protein ABTQ31_20530 [Rhizobiaceae bacterium]